MQKIRFDQSLGKIGITYRSSVTFLSICSRYSGRKARIFIARIISRFTRRNMDSYGQSWPKVFLSARPADEISTAGVCSPFFVYSPPLFLLYRAESRGKVGGFWEIGKSIVVVSGAGKWSLSRVTSSLEYLGIRQNVGHTRFVIERIAAINARELVLKPHSANAITRSSNIAIMQQRNIGKCG